MNTNSDKLAYLMKNVNISGLKELSQLSGVSSWQLARLEHGLITRMEVATIIKLSQTLQISVTELIRTFAPEANLKPDTESLTTLKQEYQRLEQQLSEQRETLWQEFQQNSLNILESWLLQWPSAVVAANNNPQFPLKTLLMLVKPVEKLVISWGLKPIASVGAQLPYNPQEHQLLEGTAQPGDLVKVRNLGYKKGNKLLYRAKVSLINI